jgi:predicted  nucleic acid-binding Zn-ribbon protein
VQNEIDRFKTLTEQVKTLDEKKIRLEEQYRNKKETLTALLKEIKAAGYDPAKLKETIQEKEEQLKAQIASFEEEVTKVSSMIAKIEV